MGKDILTVRVSRENTEVSINGTLQEIIVATLVGINSVYNSVNDHKKIYKTFVAAAVNDPNSRLWDDFPGTAKGDCYEMDTSDIDALQELLEMFSISKENDDEETD